MVPYFNESRAHPLGSAEISYYMYHRTSALRFKRQRRARSESRVTSWEKGGKSNNSLSLWERVRVREALKGRNAPFLYNRVNRYGRTKLNLRYSDKITPGRAGIQRK